MSGLNEWCFACGPKNPIGLKLKCMEQDNRYIAYFTPQPEHQSYHGTMHGGLISTLIDEITAGYINMKTGRPAFTARLETRFRQHTPIGEKLLIQGWVVRRKGRLFEMAATVSLPDGTITAEGKAKVMIIEET